MSKYAPRHNDSINVPEQESKRVQAYINRVGRAQALSDLGVGVHTLDAARDQGRLRKCTYERLFEALTRAEAARAAS